METPAIAEHYKFGIGVIKSIDYETYDIPMATFQPDNTDEPIVRMLSEFEII